MENLTHLIKDEDVQLEALCFSNRQIPLFNKGTFVYNNQAFKVSKENPCHFDGECHKVSLTGRHGCIPVNI